MKIREKFMTVLIAIVLSVGFTSAAHAVLIDLDGSGGLTGAVNIGSFDWNATSFLAQGGQTAIANFQAGTCGTVSCNFSVLSQGTLQGVNDLNGNPVVVNGLNTSYQITYVTKITETITGVVGSQANFAVVPGATGFVNIYFSPVNSTPINGSGFNDGTLILRGTTVGNATGNFTVSNGTAVNLDNSPNGNQYGSQQTISGSGRTDTIPFDTLTTNPDFFKQALAVFGIAFSNLSQSVPFDSVDPMGCFVSIDLNQLQCSTYSHVNGQPYSGQPLDANGGTIPKVGSINGAACSGTVAGIAAGCPDFVAQTDPNSPFTPAAVPEPASFFLLGFALVGLAAYRRRKLN
jgi:PEP-CTERM motif-containing protein